MPKISVLIPTWNAAKFIPRCLDSLLAQTFTDWEAICVSDGSPDNSVEILHEYAAGDKRFKVIEKKNTGVSDTRNVAMSHAAGEYIMYLDSDDFIHPQTMEITYNLARSECADMVSYCHDKKLYKQLHKQMQKNVNPLDIDLSIVTTIYSKVKFKQTDDIMSFVTERSRGGARWKIRHCYPCMALYRHKLISGMQFNKNIPAYEDIPWFGEILLRRPKTVITKLPLYYYIPNPTSIVFRHKSLKMIKNLGASVSHTYKLYQKKASPREMKIWQREFLWPFIFTMFRELRYIDSVADIKAARSVFKDMNACGMLDNPKTFRARRYQRRIMRFLK